MPDGGGSVKILLIGNYRPDGQWSMIGFEEALARELTRMQATVESIYPRSRLRALAKGTAARKWLAYADKFVLFRPRLRMAVERADLVHLCDQGNALYLNEFHHRPHLVTCHDLLALRASLGEIPGWGVSASGKQLLAAVRRRLASAANIACVSDATRRDYERLIPSKPRIHLVPNGLFNPYQALDRNSAVARLKDLGFDPRTPFLLHVGGNEPYKNRAGAVEIHRNLRKRLDHAPRLVLAGHPLSIAFRTELGDDLRTGRVVEVPRPTDDQMEALYSLAEALLFPSHDEGFGMPILEALACGCPVFTSDRPPMTEVGGSAAVYIDPSRPDLAAEVIAASWNRRADMAAAGLREAHGRGPARMAQDYLRIYGEIVG
ncbi:MAG TPA: glycosyltransferase family 1 protein [Fimbriimonas sp.]